MPFFNSLLVAPIGVGAVLAVSDNTRRFDPRGKRSSKYTLEFQKNQPAMWPFEKTSGILLR